MTWKSLKNNKHFWAFFYYLKRQGDKPRIKKNQDGTWDLWIR